MGDIQELNNYKYKLSNFLDELLYHESNFRGSQGFNKIKDKINELVIEADKLYESNGDDSRFNFLISKHVYLLKLMQGYIDNMSLTDDESYNNGIKFLKALQRIYLLYSNQNDLIETSTKLSENSEEKNNSSLNFLEEGYQVEVNNNFIDKFNADNEKIRYELVNITNLANLLKIAELNIEADYYTKMYNVIKIEPTIEKGVKSDVVEEVPIKIGDTFMTTPGCMVYTDINNARNKTNPNVNYNNDPKIVFGVGSNSGGYYQSDYDLQLKDASDEATVILASDYTGNPIGYYHIDDTSYKNPELLNSLNDDLYNKETDAMSIDFDNLFKEPNDISDESVLTR
ncbi:MAG: hypothetical protein IJ574_04150 [Bacilli bacterium]|nr:hypothetical protein [Bacilli bacterium]